MNRRARKNGRFVSRVMGKDLFVGFKGKNNASSLLVSSLSSDHILLTNSFQGLRKDIEGMPLGYERVVLFGVDKNLCDFFRIERIAEKDGGKIASALDLDQFAERLASAGIKTVISDVPTHYLCNEAYWYLLEKYRRNVVLIHIPTMKHVQVEWIALEELL